MEVAETNSGVQKSSTSMAESSQEVSVEKTATGVIEQAVSSQRKVEQSLEKSVQQDSSSTQVVQKSVSSSVSDEKPTVKEDNEDKEAVSSPPKENGEGATTVKKVEFSDKREEVKLEDIGENDEDEIEEEVEEEVIEVEGSESGEEVEVVETVVLKKQETKTTQPEIKEDKTVVEETVVLQKQNSVEKTISTPEKVVEKDSKDDVEEEEQTVQVTIKAKPPTAKQQEQVILETQQQDNEQLIPQNKTLIEESVGIVVKKCTTQETHKLEAPLQNFENQKGISQQEEFKEDVKPQPEVIQQPQKEEPKEEPKVEPKVEPKPEPQQIQQEQKAQIQFQQTEPQQTKQQQQQIYEEQHVEQQQQQIPERELQYSQQQPKLQQIYQPQNEIKQENIKNTLKEIISDIDRVIEQEEESSRIISKSTTQEQTSDGTGYTTTSQLYERSEFKEPAGYTTIQKQTTTKVMTAPPTVPNINSYISKAHRSMSLPSPQEIQHEESGTKNVDLQKIFTPATDAGEIIPKNRKLYASSAFYSPSLHPTVEDQVELARRISHSLSDISNQQSKGQSMYVNRKKRSVKWEHEGEGRAEIQEYNGYTEETKENGYTSKTSSSSVHHDKVPLRLVMNPRGQIRDFSSMRQEDFNTEAGLLSPDKCAELVTALHAPTGKGAELFAKRRKKSEKWIVDESNAATHSPGGGYAYGPLKPISPIVPAYSDVGVQRVQLNMHQDQVQDKYAQPRLKLVKTPWEAALETGNASSAFQEIQSAKGRSGFPGSGSYDYSSQNYSTTQSYYPSEPSYEPEPQKTFPKQSYGSPSSQRELAYKPSVPQGWNAPPPMLPSENTTIAPAASAYASSSAQNDSYYLENNKSDVSAATASTAIINKIDSSKSSTTQSPSHIQNESQKLDDYTYGIRTENFGQTDEDEIIQFMERTKLQQSSSKTVKYDTHLQQNFINCMAKSPELMVSEAKSNYVRYDSAVNELKTAFIKGQDSNTEKHKNDSMQQQESFIQVNLRKVEQDPEDHSRLLRKPEDDSENEEEYIKIPVKQLISSFENQKSPIIRQKSYEKPKDILKKSPEKDVIVSNNEEQKRFSQDSLSEALYHTQGDQESIETLNGQALYVPPQIPLDSYVPPSTEKYLPQSIRTSTSYQTSSNYQTTSSNQQSIYQSASSFPTYQPSPPQNQSQSQSFPLSPQSKPSAFSYSAAPPKQTTTHWVSHQGPKATGPTTAFDPSPLPYEKLAKFEQPNPDDPYASSYPPPRRLAPPSQTRVRNLSPTPFMSSSLPSKPSYQPPRSGPPAAPILSPQPQQFPTTSSNYYAPSDDSYSYGSAPSSRVSVDLSQCQNYNTAARGWNQMRDYYRPITFSKPRTELPYTDF